MEEGELRDERWFAWAAVALVLLMLALLGAGIQAIYLSRQLQQERSAPAVQSMV